MTEGAIRTVRGDVPAATLGVCDAHDHLFFSSAALRGQELDDEQAARREVADFAAAGGGAIVQWTPHGLGRRPAALRTISAATGVHVVAATGVHQAAHYPAPARPPADDLAALFIDELTVGISGGDGVRAGVIKVAGQYHRLGSWEREAIDAAAAAGRATGAAVCVHLEAGTHGEAVLERLTAAGLPAHRVILGHLTRNPDVGLHRELARAGAFLAYDGPSAANRATDWRLFDLLAALASDGLADQLLLGADTTTPAGRAATGGAPGTAALLRTGARVLRELGSAAHQAILVANPARAFALTPAGAPAPGGALIASSSNGR